MGGLQLPSPAQLQQMAPEQWPGRTATALAVGYCIRREPMGDSLVDQKVDVMKLG